MKMNKEDLVLIVGGSWSLTAAFMTAASRGINTLLDLGRTLGTSIRMLVRGQRC